MLLEGLMGEGSFRARKDKKGKKGQRDVREFLAPFCPSYPFLFFKKPSKLRADRKMD
jgi:hypothetical protein